MLIGKKQKFIGAIVVIGLFLTVAYEPNKAEADINSCSASVTPATVSPGQTAIFQIQITNTDSNNINWMRITRPSADFTIISNEATGWSSSTTPEYAYQGDSTLAPGDTMTVNVEATATGNTAPSADWIVETTDVPGINLFACSGNLGTSISGGAGDTIPPNIYNIAVSNVRTNSVDVTWSTDEPSTSLVYYGQDEQYGSSTNEDSGLTTNHSMTISGLNPNEAYHFQVVSRDGNANVAFSADNTFLTSAVDPPSPAEVIVNASSTDSSFIKTKVTLKAVPTEKVPPVVSISTNLDKPFKEAPLISGEVIDNESVAGIQYSTDNGKNWLPVDNDKGLGSNKASFSFKPVNLEDGNYQVIVRAIDTSSNVGVSTIKTLVIDRLPPQVGGSNISAGPQIFQPNEEGATYALVGVDQKITFSAVGGATDISIDAKTLSSKGSGKLLNLTKSTDTGLWSGIISFENPGEYILTANSVDGAGNKTSKIVATVQALQPARIMSKNKPLKDANVVLYYQEPTTNAWTVWDGASYGQSNPQKTDELGRFNLFVPAGKYYLKADAKDHRSLISNIFEVKETMPILSTLNMKESKSLSVAGLTVHIPPFSNDTVDVTPPKLPESKILKSRELIGKQISDFTLQDLNNKKVRSIEFNGKPTVITFVSSWSPSAREQLTVLSKLQANKDINVVPIAGQEGSGKIKPIINIAGLPLDLLVDPDGVTVDLFKVQSLPSTYIIDRRGMVKKVMVGVLSEEKIINALGDQ